MFRRKSWNRIPAYKFGYGWKPIFKCFLSQRIKRIDLNTPIFFSVRDQFQKKIWEQDSNKCAIFRSTVFVLWCVGTLSFFKIPCVWALCCGVWGLWVFQSSPVCETLSLYWRDWVFTKKSLYWGFSPVLDRLVFSGQNPCAAGDFSPVVEHPGTKKKRWIFTYILLDYL